MSAPYRFPPGFLWGAATASHQVEGDNRGNDWWAFEESGRLPHRSGAACEHYRRFREDFDLARSLGHNAHRLSIEWSRIEPRPGEFDAAALDHYTQVMMALRERGIEPIVTLHHFTNPQWFAARGGWARRDSVELFTRYVDRVLGVLGSHVRYWLTINEPTVYVLRSYIVGNWPPCTPNAWVDAWRVLRNLCRAHTAAYPVIHRYRQDALVGFAHSAPYVTPQNPRRLADRIAARLRDFVLNELCFRLLGANPRRVLDFIGINYYVRQLIRWEPRGVGWLFGKERKADGAGLRRFSSLGWEMYPPGLGATLTRFAHYGVPLIVTENGIATGDEALREEFLVAHVRELARALQAGVDVRGYCYWTLMDNFEWSEGFTAQFGLASVDRKTQARTVRPAGERYARLCRENGIAPGE